MKPIIGIMPLVDEDRDSLWMLPGYMDGISEAGGLPIMLPLTGDKDVIRQLANMCQGFLFTGGHDVSPSVYHENVRFPNVSPCPARDKMENDILNIAISEDIPVLGICRGIQFINAALGGTLYQDLPSEHPSSIDHHQSPPYDVPVHEVEIIKDSPLYDIVQADIISVNSYHHQAIKHLSPKLVAMAYSSDGLVEAVYKPGQKFLWAIQWHPEFSYKKDSVSRKIFETFIAGTISV